MKVAVLGGDGYRGWATALHLSKQGHGVAIMELAPYIAGGAGR